MNPLNAVGLALRAFSAGGDVFAKRSMAAMPPGNNVPPPPSVMPGPEFVDGAVDALAHQFQKMGFPMNDMVKAMIYRECDRRLAARMCASARCDCQGGDHGLMRTLPLW